MSIELPEKTAMKIVVPRKEFAHALGIAAAATAQRTALPILTCIKITGEGDSLRMLGCDGEMWAQASVSANVEQPGVVCVQAKLLTDIVGALADAEVILELDGTRLFLRTENSEWKMNLLNPDEFPEPPAVDSLAELELRMGVLRRGIDAVGSAVADDSSRPALSGVLFKADQDDLILVATDTHRLAFKRIPEVGSGEGIEAIVPEKALRVIRMLPVSEDDPIKIHFEQSRLSVDVGEAKVVSQLLPGPYPNWERVVPKEFTREWTMERQEVVDNVRRAMILARESANRVRLAGNGDQIIVSSRSEEKGEAKETIPCISKNGELEIAFNGKYVLDALHAIDCDSVRLEMTESSRPAILRPTEGGDDHFYVIMPMALG